MGLFDKLKKKKDDPSEIQANPEIATEVQTTEEAVPVTAEQPVQDNVFNADGNVVVESQPTSDEPLPEMQIQNVAEVPVEQTTIEPAATAAVVDNPVAVAEQQVELQVNPEAVFEGGMTIEDEITKLVTEVVNQEIASTQVVEEVVEQTPLSPVEEIYGAVAQSPTEVEEVVEEVVEETVEEEPQPEEPAPVEEPQPEPTPEEEPQPEEEKPEPVRCPVRRMHVFGWIASILAVAVMAVLSMFVF